MVSSVLVLGVDAPHPPVAHVVGAKQAFGTGFIQQSIKAEKAGEGWALIAHPNQRNPAR